MKLFTYCASVTMIPTYILFIICVMIVPSAATVKFPRDDMTIDVVILNDISGSVDDEIPEMKIFLNNIVYWLGNGTNLNVYLGLIKFENEAIIVQHLKPYDQTKLLTEINALAEGGSTNTNDALVKGKTEFDNRHKDRNAIPKVIILITDGQPNTGSMSCSYSTAAECAKLQAHRARDSGITVLSVGVGNINRVFLGAVSDHYVHVASYTEETRSFPALKLIADVLHHLAFPPPPVNPNIYKKPRKEIAADIALVVDVSKSVGLEMDEMQVFLKGITGWLNLQTNKDIKVSLLQFGDKVTPLSSLQAFNLNTINTAIDALNKEDKTATPAAIREAIKTLGPKRKGKDGKIVEQFLVILTDGDPNSITGGDCKNMNAEDCSKYWAQEAKKTGINILPIGIDEIGNGIEFLKEVSEYYVNIKNYETELNTSIGAAHTAQALDELSIPVPDITFDVKTKDYLAADIVFVVDISQSVTFLMRFMRAYLDIIVKWVGRGKNSSVKVGLVKYGDKATKVLDLEMFNDQKIHESINNIRRAELKTALPSGIQMATSLFKKPRMYRNKPVDQFMVLITDGNPTKIGDDVTDCPNNDAQDYACSHLMAEKAKNKSITILGVGVSKSGGLLKLRDQVCHFYYHAEDFNKLLTNNEANKNLVDAIQHPMKIFDRPPLEDKAPVMPNLDPPNINIPDFSEIPDFEDSFAHIEKMFEDLNNFIQDDDGSAAAIHQETGMAKTRKTEEGSNIKMKETETDSVAEILNFKFTKEWNLIIMTIGPIVAVCLIGVITLIAVLAAIQR